MADSKITALTALTAADPVNDMFPVVDVSDTSMAASGTTKKVTLNNLLACSPTAGGNFTITGDLTVDTSTLKVDSANNRVIVGHTSGASAFQVSNGGAAGFEVQPTGVNSAPAILSYNRSTSAWIQLTYGASSHVFQISGSDGITLNSTGLGVGTAPLASHLITSQGPVAISGTGGGTRTSYISNTNACSIYYTDGGGSGFFTDFGNLIIQPRTSAARSVVIATGSTTPVERAVVKSTGQVRFVPLASDPAGAEAGDVYYNSTSNKLKCYNGTTWNDLF